MSKPDLNASNLQEVLWDVLNQVKNRKMKPNESNSITFAAKEIINAARLELQWKMVSGKRLNVAPKLLDTGTKKR